MKIVGMLPVYNDEEYVEEIIDYYISQGIYLVVLDNGSTDKTIEICNNFFNLNKITLFSYKTEEFEWETILTMLYDMALRENPDWVIHIDSDEFLEAENNKKSLKEAIIDVDAEGYDTIQFDSFRFILTDKDMQIEKSIKKRLPYYTWTNDFLFRAWKYFPGIRAADAGGHLPIFPKEKKYNIFPKKFVLRHYPFISKNQGMKKLSERLSRTGKNAESKLGWHARYQKLKDNDFLKRVDHNFLSRYNEDNHWVLERKFNPFPDLPLPPKKEDIFSKDGELLTEHFNIAEFKLVLQNKRNEISDLKNQLNKYKKNNPLSKNENK